MSFTEVFVCAVPDENKDAFIKMSEKSATLHKEQGAQVMYFWADEVPDGELTSFPKAVMLKEGESVSLGWHVWESKAARDEAMPTIREAMKSVGYEEPMPFDGKRMLMGTFESIIS